MEILTEQKLVDFEFWSGAKHNAFLLTYTELERVESMLEELYETPLTETDINDLFWFDFDFVCELLGITDEEIRERGNRR